MAQNKILFIADTHFGHTNILKFQSATRPFNTIQEHDMALIDAWNSKVNNGDTVWLLGDVALDKDKLHLLNSLKGNKRLVIGNHDYYGVEKYNLYFDRIYGSATLHIKKVGKVILTHIPVHPNQLERFAMNVHGHDHHGVDIGEKYLNANVDVIGMAPMTFAELTEFYRRS